MKKKVFTIDEWKENTCKVGKGWVGYCGTPTSTVAGRLLVICARSSYTYNQLKWGPLYCGPHTNPPPVMIKGCAFFYKIFLSLRLPTNQHARTLTPAFSKSAELWLLSNFLFHHSRFQTRGLSPSYFIFLFYTLRYSIPHAPILYIYISCETFIYMMSNNLIKAKKKKKKRDIMLFLLNFGKQFESIYFSSLLCPCKVPFQNAYEMVSH